MQHDQKWMQRCLELALKGESFVGSNPMVGCVIVHNNIVVAEGFHQKFGEAHAEVNAFANLDEAINPSECKVYVNLEPCSYHGKTPACSDLLIAKNVKSVVVAALDPNPRVSGNGIKALEARGIDVHVGLLEDEAKELNKRFYQLHQNKRPYITLKWAQTKNGIIGRPKSSQLSKQISDTRNAVFTHKLRAQNQAILIGSHTLEEDNPQLNIRAYEGVDPVKIVLTTRTNFDPNLNIFKEEPPHIASSMEDVLQLCVDQGLHSILVEGGAETLQHFIDAGLWDEAIVIESEQTWPEGVLAPKIENDPEEKRISFGDTITFYRNN